MSKKNIIILVFTESVSDKNLVKKLVKTAQREVPGLKITLTEGKKIANKKVKI